MHNTIRLALFVGTVPTAKMVIRRYHEEYFSIMWSWQNKRNKSKISIWMVSIWMWQDGHVSSPTMQSSCERVEQRSVTKMPLTRGFLQMRPLSDRRFRGFGSVGACSSFSLRFFLSWRWFRACQNSIYIKVLNPQSWRTVLLGCPDSHKNIS